MIRRLCLSLVFVILGFLSILLSDAVERWICRSVKRICALYKGGECSELGMCTPDLVQSIKLGVFFFGPSIVFALTAFVFGRQPRPISGWLAMTFGVVVMHQSIVFIALR